MKKMLSNVLLISMLVSSLSACSNVKTPKTITADTPYYSVTAGSFERSKNAYMNWDIKIPKITYSNNDGNELIDTLNADIESNLTTLINEAKDRAISTYETYLQSAKDNAKKDVENRISDLEKKYKSVIGDTEKEILSKLNADDIFKYSMSNMGKMNFFPYRMASFSEMAPPNMRRGFNSELSPKRRDTEETVSGHANSEELIIPELHNKKIIVVETTTTAMAETKINISGRPGIAPSEGSVTNPSDKEERPKRASWSNGRPEKFKKEESLKSEVEKSEIEKEETMKTETSNKYETTIKEDTFDKGSKSVGGKFSQPATRSEIASSNEITIENFYRDLRRLRRYIIPDDYSLTMQYIPTTIECSYEVKCLDEDYLSLFIELSESRTTSSVKRLFYNVDLNKMKILNLKDVLGDKFKETSVKYISEAIEKWSDEQKSTLIQNYNIDNYISENTPFFINNNHKPVIEIEKFVITVGSAGYHEFQIP